MRTTIVAVIFASFSLTAYAKTLLEWPPDLKEQKAREFQDRKNFNPSECEGGSENRMSLGEKVIWYGLGFHPWGAALNAVRDGVRLI
jgi:hypothetical protein